MTWWGVWSFLKEVPAKVWAGVIWALCILGWWVARSELAKQKAENVRLKHKARQKELRNESVIRLKERKARIQGELSAARTKAAEKETEIKAMDEDELIKELVDEFGSD